MIARTVQRNVPARTAPFEGENWAAMQRCSAVESSRRIQEPQLYPLPFYTVTIGDCCIKNHEVGFFKVEKLFASGSVEFDSASLMRNIRHEWDARPTL